MFIEVEFEQREFISLLTLGNECCAMLCSHQNKGLEPGQGVSICGVQHHQSDGWSVSAGCVWITSQIKLEASTPGPLLVAYRHFHSPTLGVALPDGMIMLTLQNYLILI